MNNNTTFGGTLGAHELVHRLAGPVLDLWGKYKGPPNLMNANQAADAGLGAQVSADWSNPSATAGFASLSADQIKKMYKKCIKKHKGGGGGGGGGHDGFGLTPATWIPIFLTFCTGGPEAVCGSYFAGWWYTPGTLKGPTY